MTLCGFKIKLCSSVGVMYIVEREAWLKHQLGHDEEMFHGQGGEGLHVCNGCELHVPFCCQYCNICLQQPQMCQPINE